MKFVIEIVNERRSPQSIGLHTINVYGVRNATPYTQGICELLERMPYMPAVEVFETAITLACRLKTAGFAVDVVKSGGDDK